MTKKDFLKCFSLLENKFGKESNKKLKEVWYEIFKVYKVEELKEAIQYYLEKIKKRPCPAYLIEDLEYLKKCKAEKAYEDALIISNLATLKNGYKEGEE